MALKHRHEMVKNNKVAAVNSDSNGKSKKRAVNWRFSNRQQIGGVREKIMCYTTQKHIALNLPPYGPTTHLSLFPSSPSLAALPQLRKFTNKGQISMRQ